MNGALTTAAQLQQLAAGLVDISSQHEHQSLTDPSNHLATLDAYAGRQDLVVAVREAVVQATEAARARPRSRPRFRARADREDFLRFQVSEIAQARAETQRDPR